MKISASLYASPSPNPLYTISELVRSKADIIHIDCNDDPSVFDDILLIRAFCDTPIDLHLITSEPERYFHLLQQSPVDYLSFQFEALQHKPKLPNNISKHVGLAISPGTPVSVFDAFSDWDFLMLVAATPGFSGGAFDVRNLDRIRLFANQYPWAKLHIDGGVDAEIAALLYTLPVHVAVSGSFLFRSRDVGEALQRLKFPIATLQ